MRKTILLSTLTSRVRLWVRARARGMCVVEGGGRETAIAGVRIGEDRIVRNPDLETVKISQRSGVYYIDSQALSAHREFVKSTLVPKYGRLVVRHWGKPRYELCLDGLEPQGIWHKEDGQLPVVYVGRPGYRADRPQHLRLLR